MLGATTLRTHEGNTTNRKLSICSATSAVSCRSSRRGYANRRSGAHPAFFFPRFWRLDSFSVATRRIVRNFAGELIEGEALANDPIHGKTEAFAVSQLAVIESKTLFIEVAEQME